MHINFKKNFIWNFIGTILNSFSSLFFLVLVTRINGVNGAGIFSFGFSVACLLFYIGVYYGRVFQVTENKDISDKSFLVTKFITVFLMILISFIYLLTKNYSPEKFYIMFGLCVFKALEAFAEVIYGFFQKYEELYLSGISLTLKNVIGLIVFFLIDYFTKNIIYAVLGLIVISLLVLIFFDFYKMKKYNVLKNKVSKQDIITILKNGFFPFALSFLSLIVINSPKYAIDALLTDDMQTYFGIIVMPATVVTLGAQFIIYPFLTTVNNLISKNNIKELGKLTRNIIFAVFGIGLIATICAYLLGIPVLELIYGIKLSSYKTALIIIILGATFNASVYVLSNILISIRKLKLQTLIYTIVALVSYFSARILVSKFSIDGAFYSYSLTMVLLFTLFYIITKLVMKTERSNK